MVSIISLKQKVFCDTRECLFRCWTKKLWCFTRISLKTTSLPNIHITDLPKALNETRSYLYADDTCIFYQDKDVEKIEKVLNKVWFVFSIWVFFPDHSQITALQGKGEGISLTPHYYFHLLHRHLGISRAITAGNLPLRIASSRTRTGNLWLPNANH